MTFYLLDPGYSSNEFMENFGTLEEAIKAGDEAINLSYRPDSDEEWGDGVESIEIYEGPPNISTFDDNENQLKLVGKSKAFDLEVKPDDVDEEGWSESRGDYWPTGYDSMCNYRMEKI